MRTVWLILPRLTRVRNSAKSNFICALDCLSLSCCEDCSLIPMSPVNAIHTFLYCGMISSPPPVGLLMLPLSELPSTFTTSLSNLKLLQVVFTFCLHCPDMQVIQHNVFAPFIILACETTMPSMQDLSTQYDIAVSFRASFWHTTWDCVMLPSFSAPCHHLTPPRLQACCRCRGFPRSRWHSLSWPTSARPDPSSSP